MKHSIALLFASKVVPETPPNMPSLPPASVRDQLAHVQLWPIFTSNFGSTSIMVSRVVWCDSIPSYSDLYITKYMRWRRSTACKSTSLSPGPKRRHICAALHAMTGERLNSFCVVPTKCLRSASSADQAFCYTNAHTLGFTHWAEKCGPPLICHSRLLPWENGHVNTIAVTG